MLLVVIGAVAGVGLFHASFGFTSAWRRLIVERRSAGVRAQFVMLALAIVFFFPLLSAGEALGRPVAGFVNSVGVALVVGAFLFGIGMQLGGGCGSGTLYTAGGGNARKLVTLAAFVAGSTAATADPLGWLAWPSLGTFSLLDATGPATAMVIALAAIAALYAAARGVERRECGAVEPLIRPVQGDWWRGPWPLVLGALVLAAVNVATLVVAGRPWGITAAFALWGAKALAAAGVDVAAWPYWSGDAALTASLFSDATSVMNIGLMLGALMAAGLAGRFRPDARLPAGPLAAALVGGFLLGVGSRLATGCNIGAFFSGTASASLHGPIWLLCALPGNIVGIKLRKHFGL